MPPPSTATSTSTAETEAKLEAWAGFRLPDLNEVGEGVTAVPLPDRVLDATYYDTPDLRLARDGLTVRFRSGGGDGTAEEGTWTVKLPEGRSGPALARREVSFPGPHRVVPEAVAGLVRARVRSAFLGPVAHLVTRRRPVQLRDAEGRDIAEVADDEVSVMDGRRVELRFREVEVEVSPGAPHDVLDAIVGRLRQAGAGSGDPWPKVVRALGPRALQAPDVVVPEVDSRSSSREVVAAAVAAGVARLLAHDPGVRLGDDAEDVHQARVGTRRLRSDLRTFRSLLEPDATTAIRSELGWLAGELGRVRDADVLLERLRRQAAQLADLDPAAVVALLTRLDVHRDQARSALLDAFDSERYLALLDALVATAADPPCVEGAGRRARKVLPGLVKKPWAHLESAVEALSDPPEVEELHQVRIRAKGCRYAAEAVAAVVGKPARRLAGAVAELQGVLGDLNDAVVAQAWLRLVGQEATPAEAVVAGELVGRQWLDIEEGRRSWPAAWKRASAKSLREWMD